MPRDATPDPAAVKRALRTLAGGTAPPTMPRERPPETDTATDGEIDVEAVVEGAETAFDDVREAVAFIEADGLLRLRAAVDTAERRGDRTLARTGQRLLARVEHYRAVATGATRHGHAGDHFHPGHGTVLSADSQVRTE